MDIEKIKDEIRKTVLRYSRVREFELKNGWKVGYRVLGIEQGEHMIAELAKQNRIEKIDGLIDQLQRFEGIMGMYNCQQGGLKCNFQTNYHRLLNAEIDKLKKEKEIIIKKGGK